MEDEKSTKILLKNLEIQWNDHIQTRNQTWKALQISAVVALALIGLDWKVNHWALNIGTAILLFFVSFFGMQITIRHRNNVEVKKFQIINELERKLNLSAEHVLPGKIKWWDVFKLRKANTSLFILRMQFVIFLFSMIYLANKVFFS